MPRIFFTVSDKEHKQIKFAAKRTKFCQEPNADGKFAYQAAVNAASNVIKETVGKYNNAK